MYTCFLEDGVLLSPAAGVMCPRSPPFEVNIGNLIKNYNCFLTKNPKDVKIINERLGKLLFVPHPY